MKQSTRTDDPSKVPTERPNNIAIMIRFAVIATAALALLAVALHR